MRDKILFSLSIAGILIGLVSAYIYGIEKKPQQPVFSPAPNPYPKGIYSNGIIESYQANGANINIYPEVAGTVLKIPVVEGTTVRKGEPLLMLDDSVQRATVQQQKSQAEAALALLEELKAQPRKETLDVSKAQLEYAGANLRSLEDQLSKQRRSWELNPKSVSKGTLDNAENAVNVAKANLEVARKQYELTRSGAWIYDIRNQENQYKALSKAFRASSAQLAKYIIRAPVDGVVMSVNAAVGSYVSSQGTYDSYTRGFDPVIVMQTAEPYLGVRCYIDEILIGRLPQASQIRAQMFIRGTNISIPLEFVRIQPYVSPKIELSNQRTERVDVRVLPVIFRFEIPKDISVYSGQLVDVYIGGK